MQIVSALPYKKWLPKILKERNWSQEKLAIAMKTQRSYWSHTITGRSTVPKPKILEKVAKYLDASPYEILEYKQAKAIEMLEKNLDLLDMVLFEKVDSKEVESIIIDGKPLTDNENELFYDTGSAAVRNIRAREAPGKQTGGRRGSAAS